MMRPITGTTWRLACTDCGRSTVVRGTLAFSAYQEAARHGWATTGRDLCPACVSIPAVPVKRRR